MKKFHKPKEQKQREKDYQQKKAEKQQDVSMAVKV